MVTSIHCIIIRHSRDEIEEDYESDTTSTSETAGISTNLYTLEKINIGWILDETFKKPVKVENYFRTVNAIK